MTSAPSSNAENIHVDPRAALEARDRAPVSAEIRTTRPDAALMSFLWSVMAYCASVCSVTLAILSNRRTAGGKGDRRRRRKGDALVRRSEQLIAGDARGEQRFRVELAQTAETGTIAEQARIEKVRRPASRLGDELAESKHVTCQCKLQEFLPEIAHRSIGLRTSRRV